MGKKSKPRSKHFTKRVNYLFNDQALDDVKKLQKITGSRSEAQAVRTALGVTCLLLEQVAAGFEICLIDKDNKMTKVLMPIIRE